MAELSLRFLVAKMGGGKFLVIKMKDDFKITDWKFVGWHAQFEFKLADMWIGAFWKRQGNCVDLWICPLPCVPFHISWWWTTQINGEWQ